MGNRVTINDIAEKLGISKSLVSRALGDKYGVNDKTRANIRIAAVEMGYDFHNMRRTVKKNRGCTATVILTRDALSDELFYLRLIYSIEREFNDRYIEFKLCVIESLNNIETPISINKIHGNGIIIIGKVSLENTAAIISSGLPIVMIDTQYDHLKVNRVAINNYAGTYEAAKYLYGLGHRKIGFAGWADYSNNFKQRYKGFYNYMAEMGLDGSIYSCIGVPNAENGVLSDINVLTKLLGDEDHPTAMICGNDRIAFAIYEIAEKLCLKIPEDISVVGFDNVEKCGWVVPKLTSIDFNNNKIARYAVDILQESMNAVPSEGTRSVVLDANITIRDSVCPIKIEEK